MSGEVYLVSKGPLGLYSHMGFLHQKKVDSEENLKTCKIAMGKERGDPTVCCAKRNEDGNLTILVCNDSDDVVGNATQKKGTKVREYRDCKDDCVVMLMGKAFGAVSSKEAEEDIDGLVGAKEDGNLGARAFREIVRVMDTGLCKAGEYMVNSAGEGKAPNYVCSRSWEDVLNPILEKDDDDTIAKADKVK